MQANDDHQMEIEDFLSVKETLSVDSEGSVPFLNFNYASPKPLPVPFMNEIT